MRFWLNEPLDTESRSTIAKSLQEFLHVGDKATLAAVETLLPYHEKKLTRELVRTLCFQFAANWKSIKAGIPVQKFTGVREAMWLPMEIQSFSALQRGPHLFTKMRVEILDGTYAGFHADRAFPVGYLPIFARDLGYSRRRPYVDPVDLIDFRFVAWAEPSSKDDIEFSKYWLTPSMEEHNNALAKFRKPTQREEEERDAACTTDQC